MYWVSRLLAGASCGSPALLIFELVQLAGSNSNSSALTSPAAEFTANTRHPMPKIDIYETIEGAVKIPGKVKMPGTFFAGETPKF
jgi:hypothetical protein